MPFLWLEHIPFDILPTQDGLQRPAVHATIVEGMKLEAHSDLLRAAVGSRSQKARFMRRLREERRKLLRQLKRIHVEVSISRAECRALRLQAAKVMALSVSLESLVRAPATVVKRDRP
jgi:hypothetical protein